MVMAERAQSCRQIIRQAANAELLAAAPSLSVMSVWEADADLSVILTALFDML